MWRATAKWRPRFASGRAAGAVSRPVRPTPSDTGSRDWPSCDRFRSPHGFAQLSEHVTRIIAEPDAARQKDLVRSEKSFDLWQSILRGAGVITGCRRCADVCPVGADYAAMLSDALEAIPENTPEKEARRRDDGGRRKGRAVAGHLCRPAPLDRRRCRPAVPDVNDAACRSAEDAGRDRTHPIRRQEARGRAGAPCAVLRGKLDHVRLGSARRPGRVAEASDPRQGDAAQARRSGVLREFLSHARRRHRRILAFRRLDRHAAVLSAQLRRHRSGHGRLRAHLRLHALQARRPGARVVSARHSSGRSDAGARRVDARNCRELGRLRRPPRRRCCSSN